jgi:hypothetical protein
VLAALALALLAPWLGRGGRHWRWLPDRTTVFLALWLATEVVAYFALSPFPAARRVTGLLAVATLIAGRYAAWAWRRSDLLGFLSPRPDVRAASWGDRYERPWAVGLVVAFGVALGGVYFLSDWLDADAERRAARDAILWARSQAAEGERVWYVGHWGFQFYADELGVPPVVARDSELSAGDWIVQPEFRIYQQEVGWKRAPRYPVRTFVYEDAWPLRTIWYFYAGRRPLEPCRGPRLTAKVYRAREDFLAPAWRADGDEYDP